MSSSGALNLQTALPFWLSLLLIPMMWLSALLGGWAVLLVPVLAWGLFSVLDAALGLNGANADPETPVQDLLPYRLVTWIWGRCRSPPSLA